MNIEALESKLFFLSLNFRILSPFSRKEGLPKTASKFTLNPFFLRKEVPVTAGNGADRQALNAIRKELDREIASVEKEVESLKLELNDKKARLDEKQILRQRLNGLFEATDQKSQLFTHSHSEPKFQPRPEGRYKDVCLRELRAVAPGGLGTLEIAERLRGTGQQDVKAKSISSALSQLKKQGIIGHQDRKYFVVSS
ncbi:MAG: hypothetical protein GY847_20030 [Proteobacteria bacterium]|nr:hypothetical protein [Pseudomonadota bacterium]